MFLCLGAGGWSAQPADPHPQCHQQLWLQHGPLRVQPQGHPGHQLQAPQVPGHLAGRGHADQEAPGPAPGTAHVETAGRHELDADRLGGGRWCVTVVLNTFAIIDFLQVDLMFIQTMYGIRDAHKSGIKEEDFSEVCSSDLADGAIDLFVLLLDDTHRVV